jgi:putative tricarboxylic transport membrane protein
VKSWQRIGGVFLLIVAAVVIQQSVYVLRLFDAGQPGSGFMPFGLGVVLAVLSVLLIVRNLGRDDKRAPFFGSAWLRPALALAIMVGFTLAFNWLGAVLSVCLLVAAWLMAIERKGVLLSVATGIATGVVVYVVFELALQAPFPRGDLFGG